LQHAVSNSLFEVWNIAAEQYAQVTYLHKNEITLT